MLNLVRNSIHRVIKQHSFSMIDVDIVFGESIATHKYKNLFVIRENYRHYLCVQNKDLDQNFLAGITSGSSIHNINLDILDNVSFGILFANYYALSYIDILSGEYRKPDMGSNPQGIDYIMPISDSDIKNRRISLTPEEISTRLSDCDNSRKMYKSLIN